MDIVLGVSISPATVHMVLVEGENAAGLTVETDDFDVPAGDDASTVTAADQVISAILGTREGAQEAGHRLTSIGVTWTDQVDEAPLHELLTAHQVENVMLVSAFLGAAALAQAVGQALDYERIAMLFVEPETATVAVVDAADGSIADIRQERLHNADNVTELAGLVAGVEALETPPEGLFVIGSGVDIALIKTQLEIATALPVSVPEEPETALARGAALASAHAPLFVSSTAALAYAQAPKTGEVDPHAVDPGYLRVPDVPAGARLGGDDLAYSAVPDDDADAVTEIIETADRRQQQSRPILLLGSGLAVAVISAVVAMEVALALGIRPTVALRPSPNQSLIVPSQQAAAPPVNASAPQPKILPQPEAVAAAPKLLNAPVPAAPPVAPAPVPVPAVVPVPVPVPVPAAPPVLPDHVPALEPPIRLPMPNAVIAHESPPQPVPAQRPAPQPPVRVPPSQPPLQGSPSEPPEHGSPSGPPEHGSPTGPPEHGSPSQPPEHGGDPQPGVHAPAPQEPPAFGMPGREAPTPHTSGPPGEAPSPSAGGEGGIGGRGGPGGGLGGGPGGGFGGGPGGGFGGGPGGGFGGGGGGFGGGGGGGGLGGGGGGHGGFGGGGGGHAGGGGHGGGGGHR